MIFIGVSYILIPRGDIMSTNMKKARLVADLSQKQVALTLGVSAATVSDWESGKQSPTVANLIRLCALYNVSPNYLLGLYDNMLGLYIKKRRGNKSIPDFANFCGVEAYVIEELESSDSINRANHIYSISKKLNVDENYLFCLLDHVNPHRVTNVCIPSDDIYLDLMEPGDISQALRFNSPFTSSLSPEENTLVQSFRDLPPMQQGQVIGYLDALRDSQSFQDAQNPTKKVRLG